MSNNKILLPDNLKGRSIHEKVIPTVCNLENMLEKLVEGDGNYDSLKSWEQRSYNAYQMDKIKDKIINASSEEWKEIIKEHIINQNSEELGASCIDIYLVAYVAEKHGSGRQNFIDYVLNKGISDKENSAKAIWQVGRGDGEYLKVLNDDGTVKDWEFFAKWIGEEQEKPEGNYEEELKKMIDTVDNESKQSVNQIKSKVDKISATVDQQKQKLQNQQEKINELSAEVEALKGKRELSLWSRFKNTIVSKK